MSELREMRTVGGLVPGYPFLRDARAAFGIFNSAGDRLGFVLAHLGAGGGRWSAFTAGGTLVSNRSLTQRDAIRRLLEKVDA